MDVSPSFWHHILQYCSWKCRHRSLDPQRQHRLGACEKCKTSGSTPKQTESESLRLGSFVAILKFEKHCSKGHHFLSFFFLSLLFITDWSYFTHNPSLYYTQGHLTISADVFGHHNLGRMEGGGFYVIYSSQLVPQLRMI